MESQYLKPKFKNDRSNIGIWGAIALGVKGLVYFLEKKDRINSDFYIN